MRRLNKEIKSKDKLNKVNASLSLINKPILRKTTLFLLHKGMRGDEKSQRMLKINRMHEIQLTQN